MQHFFTRPTFALLIAAGLHGCGGGGDSAPASTLSPSDYLRIGVVSNDASAGKTLVIFDPDAPATPRLSLRLSAADSFDTVHGAQVDVAAQAFTRTPDTAAYVVQGQQLFRVSLKKSDATAARRVSSLTTACSVNSTTYMNSDETGWLVVTEAGPDLNCAGATDNRIAYVRPDASAATAPTYLPSGVQLVESLPDPTFTQTRLLLALDARGGSSKLTVYRPDLSAPTDVAGGAGVTSASLLIGPLSAGNVVVHANNQLKTLTWNDDSATLSSQSAYTATSARIDSWSDVDALYFADGLKILRLPRGGTVQTLATLSAVQGDEAEVSQLTSDRVLITQTASSTGVRTVYALPKTGGTPVTLTSADNVFVLGTSGSTLYYAAYFGNVVGGVLQPHSTVHRVNLDGTQRTSISTYAEGFPDVFFNRVYSFANGYNIDGIVWCEPAIGGDVHCANGTLKMLNTSSGVATTLGSFSHNSTYSRWSAFDYDNFYNNLAIDEPLVLLTRGTRTPGNVVENELYIARPGVTGSLTQVNAAP